MHESMQIPISIDGDGKGIVVTEEEITQFTGYEPQPTPYAGLFALASKTRRGVVVRALDVRKPNETLSQKTVWQRGDILPRPLFEKRRQRARNKVAKAAGILTAYRSIRL